MAYIGNQPALGNFVKLDAIVTSATATYNLLNGGVAFSPGSANQCIVSLNGVIQEPTSASNVGGFTISGSTIVFTSALTSLDVIDFILVLGDVLNIGTPSDATVTTAKLAGGLTVTHAVGAVGTPSITFDSDSNTGIFSPAADTIAFTEGGAEAMRIDSSGTVGIGTTNPQGKLTLSNGSDNNFEVFMTNPSGGSDTTLQAFNRSGSVYKNLFLSSLNNIFLTGGSERMRIDSSGNVLVGKTTAGATSTAGCEFGTYGAILTRAGSDCLIVNRETNDGTIISIRQAAIEEGTISVSGVTVSYNGFTGTHWSRFIDESKPDVLRGTVMESLDQMTDWYHAEFETSHTEKDKDGNDVVKTVTHKKPYALKVNENEGDVITYNFEETDYQATIVKQADVKHMMSKISDTSEAKNVYGVFHAWDNDDLINNDFYVASVGSYVVRIKAGQTVSKGDLLQSNGDGTAKVQADDVIRASTFAKVLSNTVIQTYEDGSFIVPCSLMC